jgi:amidase
MVVRKFGFAPMGAYRLVSVCPDVRIYVYQMCKLAKLSFVAGAELLKQYVVTS